MNEIDHLKYENERLRDELYQSQVEEERRHREQRKRREEERRAAQYTAETWEDAFWKNMGRMRDELAHCQRDAEDFPDESSFARMAEAWRRDIAANERAREIVQEKLKVAEEACRKLREVALAEAADQIDAEFPQNEIACFVRADDKDGLLYW